MDHPNIDLVRRVYGAYLPGNRDVMSTLIAPDVQWHNSGFDAMSGDLAGIDEVFGYLFADNHLEDYALEVVDMLVGEERVAVIARTSGRRGDQAIVNDFVQLIRIDDGRIVEVWNYNWDQRALAEAFPAAA